MGTASRGASAASLGQLAVLTGTITLEQCKALCKYVKERAEADRPLSLARCLLKSGLSSRNLKRLLRKGAGLDEVRCDACGHRVAQDALPERREYPCETCGSLIMGFAAFARSVRKEARERAPGPHGTARLAGAPSAGEGTLPFGQALALPPGASLELATPRAQEQERHDVSGAGDEDDAAGSTTLRTDLVLDLPDDGEEGPAGRSTLPFGHVFVLPTSEPAARRPLTEKETALAIRALIEDSSEEEAAFSLPDPLAATQRFEGVRPPESWDTPEIGSFYLLRILGEGAVGRVYLARRQRDGQQVALKVLRREAASDPETLRRFQREARAMDRLKHPHVIGVVEAGHDEARDLHYVAMEWADGGSLLDLLRGEGRLPERRALRLVRGVLKALSAAAAEGILHRDIKPENILLTKDGVAKLSDLGLVKDLEQASFATSAGVVLGTPCYIAPEQALGVEDLDIRADIYALGFCLWQCLVGRIPFDEDDAGPLEIIARHIEEDLPDVRLEAPDVSDAVAQVVRGMTAKEREDRYRDPEAVVADIDRIFAGETPFGPGGAGPVPRGTGRRSRPEAIERTLPAAPPAGAFRGDVTQEVPPPDALPAAPAGSQPSGGSRLVTVLLLLLVAAGGLGLLVWAGLWVRYWALTGRLGG